MEIATKVLHESNSEGEAKADVRIGATKLEVDLKKQIEKAPAVAKTALATTAPAAPAKATKKTAVKEEPKKAPEAPKITVTMDDAVIAGIPS